MLISPLCSSLTICLFDKYLLSVYTRPLISLGAGDRTTTQKSRTGRGKPAVLDLCCDKYLRSVVNVTVYCWTHSFRDLILWLVTPAALGLRRGPSHGIRSMPQRLFTSGQSGSREREDTRDKNVLPGNALVTYFWPLTF